MWLGVILIVSFSARIDLYAMNPVLRINDTTIQPVPILKFPVTQICYNIVYFNMNQGEIVKNFQLIYPKSIMIFKSMSSSLINRADCNLFIIFINSDVEFEFLKRITFRPFTRILIILHRPLAARYENVQIFINYWFIKSISVLIVDFDVVYDLSDFLSDDSFIDRLLRNENGAIIMRTSFFNCPPFVIQYKKDGKSRYDGIEMRCLREITRNWAVTYHDKSMETNTWNAVLSDLNENVSDVAICSVWQSEDHAKNYDLSSYINYQCVTILVPKPSAITQASIIYLPFHWTVWLIFITSLILMAVAIKCTIDVELKLNTSRVFDRKYKEIVNVLFELLNISTSHGLFRFPYRLTIQLLFFGWILLMFLLDTSYSTVYTSMMTIPQYSKPIETIRDFLNSNLQWSEPIELFVGMQELFRNTGSASLKSFADRAIVDTNLNERLHMLENREIAKIVKVLSNKYVTDLEFVLDYAVTMTPMKECLVNYYSVFAFQKNSQFTRIFDRQINRMKAAGLFDSWFDLLISQYFNKTLMPRILDYHYGRNDGPKTLELKHLSGGFYLLFAGLTISFVTLICEIYWKRLQNRGLASYF